MSRRIPKDIIEYLQDRGIWGQIYIPVPSHIKTKQARNQRIREMHAQGVSQTRIAARLNISRKTVYNIIAEEQSNGTN